MVFLIAHYSACVFIALARGSERGWSKNTWVADFFNAGEDFYIEDDDWACGPAFGPLGGGGGGDDGDPCVGAPAFQASGDDDMRHPSRVRLWVIALYWAMTTLTTVGYGDVSPVSSEEMLFTMCIQFTGSCVLSLIHI